MVKASKFKKKKDSPFVATISQSGR